MLPYFALALTALGLVVSWMRGRWPLGAAVMAFGLASYAIDAALWGRWIVFGIEVGCIGLVAVAALLYKRRTEQC